MQPTMALAHIAPAKDSRKIVCILARERTTWTKQQQWNRFHFNSIRHHSDEDTTIVLGRVYALTSTKPFIFQLYSLKMIFQFHLPPIAIHFDLDFLFSFSSHLICHVYFGRFVTFCYTYTLANFLSLQCAESQMGEHRLRAWICLSSAWTSRICDFGLFILMMIITGQRFNSHGDPAYKSDALMRFPNQFAALCTAQRISINW